MFLNNGMRDPAQWLGDSLIARAKAAWTRLITSSPAPLAGQPRARRLLMKQSAEGSRGRDGSPVPGRRRSRRGRAPVRTAPPTATLAELKELPAGWPQLQELRSAADSRPAATTGGATLPLPRWQRARAPR